ncbi:hypothetical protein Plano_2314 [Planococcus sp. PAMC 21323]|uniref:hypothetical protein n=1 Tax=Planococcus sp. PAMC 21323 TaxID=1526927 RepID=UPI00056F3332|nr:hypothetical protein [Planococcus sp. PAMC 21323]AIY06279.1 hypothetical protein Plano_2314 [Planococcus sp. PAMC 21323]
MKKKIVMGLIIVVFLFVGIYGYNLYKNYQDFNSLRSLLYDGYIPDSKEFAIFLEEYESFNNSLNLTTWQVEKGYDMNLELSRKFENTEIILTSKDVQTDEARKLKGNVLVAIDNIQIILNRTYESDDINDLTPNIEVLRAQIQEMNEILNNN